jgi:deferrochelatase/peroxidase EfeB
MRDMLDPRLTSPNPRDWDGSAITNRRRILRRGLPYGPFDPPQNEDTVERGVIFKVMCADLFRQFEFVLQQWINFGRDVNAGNDTCPLLGRHQSDAKFVIQADPEGEATPWIMNGLPQFVATRGGEYFFVPGINTLTKIAEGLVDPT